MPATIDSIALTTLTDPEAAAASVYELPKFAAHLAVQLKLNLLLSEHLLLSDGFLFDNPGLWYLLRNTSLGKLLAARDSNDKEATAIITTRAVDTGNIDFAFRSWFIRSDTKTVNPSCIRSFHHRLGQQNSDAESIRSVLASKGDDLRLSDFFESCELPYLREAEDEIARLLVGASRKPKSDARHSVYLRCLQQRFEPPTSSTECDDDVEMRKFRELLFDPTQTQISRSEIEKQFRTVWQSHQWQFASARIEAHLCAHQEIYPHANMQFNPTLSAQEAPVSRLADAVFASFERHRPNGSIVFLEDLAFEDILEIRQYGQFRDSMRQLAFYTNSHRLSELTPEELSNFKEAVNKWGEALKTAVKRMFPEKLTRNVSQGVSGRPDLLASAPGLIALANSKWNLRIVPEDYDRDSFGIIATLTWFNAPRSYLDSREQSDGLSLFVDHVSKRPGKPFLSGSVVLGPV